MTEYDVRSEYRSTSDAYQAHSQPCTEEVQSQGHGDMSYGGCIATEEMCEVWKNYFGHFQSSV